MNPDTMIHATGPGANETVTRLLHGALCPSPTNPRKHFAPGPLRELAMNIISLARRAITGATAELGVQTPLFVRAVAGEDGRSEIIAGERRWRATELAMELVKSDEDAAHVIERLQWMPVLLKSWSDDEVIEFQLIENLRRDDLTPIEEADGYQAMIARGNTPEQIAAKVGTSLDDVYKALKWSRLPPLARLAFEKGLIGKSHATMIARVPDEMERRVLSLMVALDDDYRPGYAQEEKVLAAREKKAMQQITDGELDEMMSRRRLTELIAEDFMRTLVGVSFDLDDALLMPVQLADGERVAGGACADCPHRTGCSPLFASEVAEASADHHAGAGKSRGIDPNTCTKPSCRAQKIELQWQHDTANAAKEGVIVLDEKEAAKVFYQGSAVTLRGAQLVPLDSKPDVSLLGHGNMGRVQTWEKMLKGKEVQIYLAKDGTGNPRRLVSREVAILAVNEKCAEAGKDSPLAAASEQRVNADNYKEEQKKKAEEEKRDKRAYSLALAELMAVSKLDLDGWRLIAKMALHQTGIGGLRALAGGLGVKPAEPADSKQLDQGHYAAALIECYVEQGTLSTLPGVVMTAIVAQESWRGLDSSNLREACKHFGVSLTEVKARARDEMKQKAKKTAKAKETKPLKPGQKGNTLGMYDRGESGAPVEAVYSAGEEHEHYHCDECGRVCEVPSEDVPGIEMMREGDFVCSCCRPYSDYDAVSDQAAWELWTPDARAEQIEKDEAEHPALGLINQRRRSQGLVPETMKEAREKIVSNIDRMASEESDEDEGEDEE